MHNPRAFAKAICLADTSIAGTLTQLWLSSPIACASIILHVSWWLLLAKTCATTVLTRNAEMPTCGLGHIIASPRQAKAKQRLVCPTGHGCVFFTCELGFSSVSTNKPACTEKHHRPFVPYMKGLFIQCLFSMGTKAATRTTPSMRRLCRPSVMLPGRLFLHQ